ncbi:hypothetical protein [Streptomyces sp. B6B3]|uniref:hypothetical protein n=1 Tax=Streptomyces sp. B6B3 TaxID=3153570 RepID=UPI00325D053F
MPLTLGAAFDASASALRAAASALPQSLPPEETLALLSQVHDFFQSLRAYPDHVARMAAQVPGSRTVLGRRLAPLRSNFAIAEQHLARALQRCEANGIATGRPEPHLEQARVHLGVSRDLLNGHRGPDNTPRSPYLYLLGAADAQNYVFTRITELAWHTGGLVQQLAPHAGSAETTADLRLAQEAMHQAVILGRQSASPTLWEFCELPLVAAPRNTQPERATLLERMAEDCDRILLSTFQVVNETEAPLSGSDLQQIARYFTLGHLLTGRTLIHLSQDRPSANQEHLRQTANDLRDAAKQWQALAQSFHRIVDLSDPREHPALPRFSYTDVHTGRANPMPKTQPHRVTVAAADISLRIGQLLYGDQWQPTTRAPQPRPTADIAPDAEGLRTVVVNLHRSLATAHYLADAGPYLLGRIQHNLVTDAPEHRPVKLGSTLRWYALPAHQLDELCNTFHTIATAAGRANETLTTSARSLGADLPRAHLDTATRKAIPLALPLERPLPRIPGINAPAASRRAPSWALQTRRSPGLRGLDDQLRVVYTRSGRMPVQPSASRPSHRAPGIS